MKMGVPEGEETKRIWRRKSEKISGRFSGGTNFSVNRGTHLCRNIILEKFIRKV